MKLEVKKLRSTAIVPKYSKPGDSGMDLHACFPNSIEEPLMIEPGKRALIQTGIAVSMPEGYELQVRPRSGLALMQGITVLNTPGTIDSSYRGAIGVILLNTGDRAVGVHHGDRIAQAVIAPVIRAEIVEVEELGETERGAGGFGSTGVAA